MTYKELIEVLDVDESRISVTRNTEHIDDTTCNEILNSEVDVIELDDDLLVIFLK